MKNEGLNDSIVCRHCDYEFNLGDVGYSVDTKSGVFRMCKHCFETINRDVNPTSGVEDSYEVSEDAVLWRYMDFSKYVSLISSKSIFLSSSDRFEDPFEGAKGVKENQDKWNSFYLSFFRRAIKHPPECVICDLTPQDIKKQALDLLDGMALSAQKERQSTFISCWHENNLESEAMWKLYSSNVHNAIAIKTTVKQLRSSIDQVESLTIGKVKYLDLRTEFAGINEAYLIKRKFFEHEQEVRLIKRDYSQSGSYGVKASCNVEKLIQKVYVSPYAPPWFFDVVRDVNKAYGLSVDVISSELNKAHFW
jgi:hypothetical protein